jgi:hypothetical protein
VHGAVWQPHPHPGPAAPALDRGWAAPPPRSTVVVIGSHSGPAQRPSPPPAQHPGQAVHSEPAHGALIGVQSAQETRQFSSRGQESRQAMPHPQAPATHSPPAAPPHPGSSSHSPPPPPGRH